MTARTRRLLVAAVLGVAAGVAAWAALAPVRWERAARAAHPAADGRLEVAGIEARVTVLRDARGIPHVDAGSEADALFGLGFVHAQDRIQQMLWLRQRARGRAAEWAGAAALPGDRLARTLGIAALSKRRAGALDPDTRRSLEAYARGVTARLDRIRAGRAELPPGLRGLEGALTPWTPADTLAVLKLWAWGLESTLDAILVQEALIQRLGGIEARPFFVGPLRDGAPPLTEARLERPGTPGGAPGALGSGGRGDPLRRALGLSGRSVGSTAWVVAGRLSSSGRPLLAADAHLEATFPSMYYEAHYRGGGVDVAGATIPGVPVVWIGRNPHVAWAATHAGAIVTDLFVETLDPGDPTRFYTGSGWRPLATRRERIRVRGGGDVMLPVRETRHGPLVNELLSGSRDPLALAWAGARTERGPRGLLRAARARDARELRRALAAHDEPVLAFAYADAEGAAGIQVAGWIPERSLRAGLATLPGRAGWYDWRGPVPFQRLPHAVLGDGGRFLIASDNRLADPDAGDIEWLWRSGERADRIAELLAEASARGPLDARALAQLQTDVYSGRALTLIEDTLSLLRPLAELGAEEREIARLLRAWDGAATAASAGAAAYHVFVDALTHEILDRWIGPRLRSRYLGVPQAHPARVVAEVVRATADGADAPEGLERALVRASIERSLRAAWLRLSVEQGANRGKWTWGRLHLLRFRPLSPGHARARAPGLGPFPHAGDGATVAVGEFDPADPFETRVASTYRFAVDTAALDQALSSLAPGQSGHAGHPNQLDGVARWLAGRPGLLLTSRLLVEEGAESQLVLEPAR